MTSLLFLSPFAAAQLSGSVGPTTSLSSKSTLCNVLDYGGSVGSSDIGPAIQKAFDVRGPSLLVTVCALFSFNHIAGLCKDQQQAVHPVCSCRYGFFKVDIHTSDSRI